MKHWLKQIKSAFEELLVGFFLTVCGYAIVFGFIKMLWALYCETQVCKKFIQGNAQLFDSINSMMRESIFIFPFTSSLLALEVCLVLAIACQLLLVKRYLYDSRGLPGKVALFGLPCTAAVAWYSGNQGNTIFFIFHLLPTINLMGYCFKFIAQAAPSNAQRHLRYR